MPHVIDIIQREIISQYNESPLFIQFLEALASEGDNFSIAAEDVNKFRTLQFAEGKNLDVLGLLVGQSREVVDTNIQIFFGFDPDPLALSFTDLNNLSLGGRYRSASELELTTRLLSDNEYRAVISAAVQRNISKCTPNEIIEAVIFVLGLLGPVPKVALSDGNTYYLIYIGRILNIEEKAFLSSLNLLPKPAGVRVGYIEYNPLDYFGFLQDSNAKGFGSIKQQLVLAVSDIINPGLLITRTYREIIINHGPLGYWPFSEPFGTQISINEMGGPDADNSPVLEASLGQVPLKISDLTTSIKHILPSGRSEIPLLSSNPLHNLSVFTIELVFMIDSNESAQRRTLINFQRGSIPTDNVYWFYVENNNQIGATLFNISSQLSQPISVDIPHYLVITRDIAGEVLIYLNNVLLLNAGIFPRVDVPANIMIGNDSGTLTTPSLLFISDVAIYDNIISASTIKGHYDAFFGDLLRIIRDYETVTVNRSNVLAVENASAVDAVAVTMAPDITDYESTVIADSPISYWRLGELIGTVAVDEMSLMDLNYINNPIIGIPGLVLDDMDTAVLLTSSAKQYLVHFITVPEYSFSDGVNDLPFSFEALINLSSMLKPNVILSKTNIPNQLQNEYLFRVETDGSVYCVLYTGNTFTHHRWGTAPGLILPNTTYHIIATYGSAINTGKILINGVDVSVGYYNNGVYTRMRQTNSPLQIGVHFLNDLGFESFYDGVIDEVAIYNYVLTAAQANNHYNAANTILPATNYFESVMASNPISYYRLDEATGINGIDQLGGPSVFHTPQVVVGAPAIKVNDTSLSAGYESNTWLQKSVITPIASDAINISGDISIEFMFVMNNNDPFQNRILLTRLSTSGSYSVDYNIFISGDRLTAELPDSASQVSLPDYTIPNRAYHIVLTVDVNGMSLYQDGLLVSSSTLFGPRVPAVTPIYIGNDEQYLPLLGRISDVAFFDRILTAVEILEHANFGLGN